MRCFHQPLAFVSLFIGLCSVAWSQASFTSSRHIVTDPCATLTAGATVTCEQFKQHTSTQATSDPVKSQHVSRHAYE
jgi:hypothetical protein